MLRGGSAGLAAISFGKVAAQATPLGFLRFFHLLLLMLLLLWVVLDLRGLCWCSLGEVQFQLSRFACWWWCVHCLSSFQLRASK